VKKRTARVAVPDLVKKRTARVAVPDLAASLDLVKKGAAR